MDRLPVRWKLWSIKYMHLSGFQEGGERMDAIIVWSGKKAYLYKIRSAREAYLCKIADACEAIKRIASITSYDIDHKDC
jgi:hypothetical protein